MSLTTIAVAAVAALALIVLMVGWSLNRAMRSKGASFQAQATPTRAHRGVPIKWATTLIIIAGIVACLVFVVIPALKSSASDNGAWQTRAVTPVTFIQEGTTQSADSNGQWSSKCYIFDIGNNWKVASQNPLNIGQTYNIRGQVQILTDGTTWFIEEARR